MPQSTTNNTIMTNKFDSDFDKIKTLNWYPWIGKNYVSKGILILGESHYEDGDEWQNGNKNTSRIITEKRIDNERGKWTLHNNVEKSLLNKNTISIEERNDFWNSVTYWNLIQRLLDSRHRNDRPIDEDFDNGWKTFFQVIEILQPKHIIVLGKASCGRLGYYLQNSQSEWSKNDEDFQRKEKKVITLKKGEKEIKLIFINHPSGSFGFNYEKWAELIKEELTPKTTVI